jgi:hypothetical protein
MEGKLKELDEYYRVSLEGQIANSEMLEKDSKYKGWVELANYAALVFFVSAFFVFSVYVVLIQVNNYNMQNMSIGGNGGELKWQKNK